MRRTRPSHSAHAYVPLAVCWGGRGEAAVVLRAAMSAFGAAALPSGSSTAAGTRSGSSDSLEKIDMSLGEVGDAGEREGLRLIRALRGGGAGPGGGRQVGPRFQRRLKLVTPLEFG